MASARLPLEPGARAAEAVAAPGAPRLPGLVPPRQLVTPDAVIGRTRGRCFPGIPLSEARHRRTMAPASRRLLPCTCSATAVSRPGVAVLRSLARPVDQTLPQDGTADLSELPAPRLRSGSHDILRPWLIVSPRTQGASPPHARPLRAESCLPIPEGTGGSGRVSVPGSELPRTTKLLLTWKRSVSTRASGYPIPRGCQLPRRPPPHRPATGPRPHRPHPCEQPVRIEKTPSRHGFPSA